MPARAPEPYAPCSRYDVDALRAGRDNEKDLSPDCVACVRSCGDDERCLEQTCFTEAMVLDRIELPPK